MKRVLLNKIKGISVALFSAAALLTSCNVDDSYDLSKIESDNIGFGTDESVFDAPLADITIDASKLVTEQVDPDAFATRSTSDLDLSAIIGNLGALAPDGEYHVDINKLAEDQEYAQSVADAISANSEKQSTLAELIYNNPNYQEKLAEEVPALNLDSESSLEEYTTQVNTYFDNQTDLTEFVTGLQNVGTEMQSQSKFDIDEAIKIDIDQDVLEMLGKNLDGDKNTLRLVTTYTTDLPLAMDLTLSLNFVDIFGTAYSYKINVLEVGADIDSAYTNPEFSDVESLDELKNMFNNPTLKGTVNILTCSEGDLVGKKIWLKVLARKRGSIVL